MYLVTGASGFVGAHFVKRLLDKNYEVVVIIRDKHPKNVLDFLNIKDKVHVVYGDITNSSLAERVISDYGVSTILHFAAQTIVKNAIRSPLSTFHVNINGTINLLEASRKCDIETFYYSSTDKVYGNNEVPYVEDMLLLPNEPYSASKVCAEMLIRSYNDAYGLNTIVSRACNIVGEGDINPRIVPNVIRACLRGERPFIYKGVKGIREYIYVGDIVDAYFTLIKNSKKCKGQVFNVGSGHVKSQEEIVKVICDMFKIKPQYKSPKPYMSNEIKVSYVSSEKIKRMLGWKAKVSFSQIIHKTVEWWKNNMC